MKQNHPSTLEELARSVGPYPPDAFAFVREGLSFVSRRIHGPETPVHLALQKFLREQEIDWNELLTRYYTGSLPEALVQLIDDAGGWEKLNRHVSGKDLCWGLRDFALRRWGMMARLVLDSWNIRKTDDFGRIVFGFIEADLMQKQPEDTFDDFQDVFSFVEAFDNAYKSRVSEEESEE
jgi:uncharacterized repeat protein (TIGR04138 family)